MFCNSIITNIKSISKILIIALLGFCLFYGCKKDRPKEKNQELKAIVVDAAGNTVLFNATGSKADMGRYYSPSTFSISAINGANAYIIIQFNPVNANAPGTYPLSECQYRVERNSGAIYFNSSQNGPGTIAITAFTDTYIEGNFSLVCLSNSTVTDSVTIIGTVKGKYEN
jgi:hypothetical protein